MIATALDINNIDSVTPAMATAKMVLGSLADGRAGANVLEALPGIPV